MVTRSGVAYAPDSPERDDQRRLAKALINFCGVEGKNPDYQNHEIVKSLTEAGITMWKMEFCFITEHQIDQLCWHDDERVMYPLTIASKNKLRILLSAYNDMSHEAKSSVNPRI